MEDEVKKYETKRNEKKKGKLLRKVPDISHGIITIK